LTIAGPDAYRRRLVPWEEAEDFKIGRRNAEERRLDADILCSPCTSPD